VKIYLAEIVYHTGSASGVLYYSSGLGFNNGGTFYEPRIEQPALYKRDVSISNTSFGGRTNATRSELTLVNNDGALNSLANYFFDGRKITIRVGDDGASYGSFTTVLVCTIEDVSFERKRVSFRLRDKVQELDKPHSELKYAGTNVLPLGLEGTEDDLKDQYKPLIYGHVALMAPVQVNTSHLIYQISSATISGGVVNAFDAGAYLARQTPDYSDTATLQAAGQGPASGYYKQYTGAEGTYIRLGATPYGQLTCSVVEDWDHTDVSASGIIKRLLIERGYTASDYVDSDFTTLNEKCCGSHGVVVDAGETTASIIDRIATSVGAWWGFDAMNRFRIARLDAPSGSSSYTIDDNIIKDIDRNTNSIKPIWRATIRADRNFSVQAKSGLAGVVPQSRQKWFGQEYREQKYEQTSLKTSRLLSEDQTYDSTLSGISQAQAEAKRRLTMLSVRRDNVTVTCADPDTVLASVDLGYTVTVQSAKYGYTSGRNMVVTGIRCDLKNRIVDLDLWG
jgi:hypothetical protein